MTKLLQVTAALLCGQIAAMAAEADDEFARWEADIAKFEAQDARHPPAQNAVLFVGSSSIRLWDLPKYFPDQAVINRGFGGSELADATHFADRIVLKHRPRTIVLYAGDNDIARGKSAQRVRDDFLAFVRKVQDELPESTIVYISIKPSIARWQHANVMEQANQAIAAECARHDGLEFVDVWGPMLEGKSGPPPSKWFVRDGLHLNDQGYRLWTSRVQPHVVEP